MTLLSKKLAGIELDIFTYGKHLGSVEKKITIVNRNLILGMQINVYANFRTGIISMGIQLLPYM
jgi:hypothetical protein